MSGLGKQKSLARRIDRELEVEGLLELTKQKEQEVEFGCSCRPIHCEPRLPFGALILRVPNPFCAIHGEIRKTFSEMSAGEFIEALKAGK